MDDPGKENLLAIETVALARIFIAHLPWLVEDAMAGLPGAVACVGWPKQTTDTCFVLCRSGGSAGTTGACFLAALAALGGRALIPGSRLESKTSEGLRPHRKAPETPRSECGQPRGRDGRCIWRIA